MEVLVQKWISVVIHPSKMDQLQRNIIKNILGQVVGKCMENVGYVIDVDKVLEVRDENVTSRTGSANFNALCVLKAFQVNEGDIVEAKITDLIYDKGIYADFDPLFIFAKWHPQMGNLYEGNHCKFKILRYRLDDTKIQCIGEYVPTNNDDNNQEISDKDSDASDSNDSAETSNGSDSDGSMNAMDEDSE